MITAAYCRYSSDQQRAASIADQLRNIRAHCEREGWPEPLVYQDAAISGARADRPDYQRMLEDAQAGRFHTLLVDDFHRLGRDLGESWQAIKLLKFAGVRVVGVCDGTDTARRGYKLDTGLKGLIGEQYLDDLADKTHRGLTGQALQGYSAGGKAYGYTTVPAGDGRRRIIVESEARTVRRIFERYADGWSPRQIADDLNRQGIPSPRGGKWKGNALSSHIARGLGILNNPLYIGQIIWNRSRWEKNPLTGRRHQRQRPQSEWIIAEDEQLRIVDQTLWNRVKARQKAIHEANSERGSQNGAKRTPTGRTGAPRYLLSGILTCAECGSRMIIVDRYNYGCSQNKTGGHHACRNGTRIKRRLAEERLLAEIKADLLNEDAYKAFERECRRLLADHKPHTSPAAQQLRQATRERENLLAAIKAGILTPSTKAELQQAEARIAEAQRTLQALAAIQPAQLLPRAREAYQALVHRLEHAQDIPATREAIRDIIGGEIKIAPDERGRPVAELPAGAFGQQQLSLVAGAGFGSYFAAPRVVRRVVLG